MAEPACHYDDITRAVNPPAVECRLGSVCTMRSIRVTTEVHTFTGQTHTHVYTHLHEQTQDRGMETDADTHKRSKRRRHSHTGLSGYHTESAKAIARRASPIALQLACRLICSSSEILWSRWPPEGRGGRVHLPPI